MDVEAGPAPLLLRDKVNFHLFHVRLRHLYNLLELYDSGSLVRRDTPSGYCHFRFISNEIHIGVLFSDPESSLTAILLHA